MTLNFNWKRLAIAIFFILVTVGFAIAIYFVFFRQVFPGGNRNGNVNVPFFPNINGGRNVNGVGNVNGGFPNANVSMTANPTAQGGLTRTVELVETVPGGTTIASNGRDLLSYDPTTGKFSQISPDGKTTTPLTTETFKDAEQIVWSPLRDKAILEFPDDSKFLYDFRKKKQYTLAPEMTDISFSPSGDRVVFNYLGQNPEDNYMVISNPDGTGARSLEPLNTKASQFTPNWSPAGNIAGTFVQSVDANRQEMIPIGLLDENFSGFTLPGRGYQGSWSPAGDKLLYSVFMKESGYNPELYLADGRIETLGSNNVNLELETWPSKCTFNNGETALYCAVPQYLEQGSGLYPALSKDIPDDFYTIDLVTGSKTLLATPVNESDRNVYRAQQVFLSADETLLYFFDQNSQRIQKIQLR